MSFLKVSGIIIVDGDDKEVILRGAGLGGWMNMENFINGKYYRSPGLNMLIGLR